MSTKPIGIVVEGGYIAGIVGIADCDAPIHVIDLDASEIYVPEPMTDTEYRNYTKGYTLVDFTTSSPYQNPQAVKA